MRLTVTVEISKEDYADAVAKGWNERFGEDLTGDDIVSFNNTEDFISAVPFMEIEVFKSVKVE